MKLNQPQLSCITHSALPWLTLGILLLLSGCASEPVVISKQPVVVKPTHVAPKSNAAYNRPYTVRGKTYYPLPTASGYHETGIASWYGDESGSKTSMGSHFNPEGVSAAHKTLPLPSRVRVTNLANGRSVDVLVNDRGPFKKGRIIDLSRGAARKIGVNGTAKVLVEHVEDLAQNE